MCSAGAGLLFMIRADLSGIVQVAAVQSPAQEGSWGPLVTLLVRVPAQQAWGPPLTSAFWGGARPGGSYRGSVKNPACPLLLLLYYFGFY